MIVQNKYIRTCIALSSMAAASLFFGNENIYAEEQDAAAETTRTDDASAAVSEQTAASPVEQQPQEALATEPEATLPQTVETVLAVGVPGDRTISGTATAGVYLSVFAGEKVVGEQLVDETGHFTVSLIELPADATTLKVKVYADDTKTLLLTELEWQVPASQDAEADEHGQPDAGCGNRRGSERDLVLLCPVR